MSMEGVVLDTSGRFAKFKASSLGFTLIEIMIVIAIVGILAMVTVPKYKGVTDHYHLESSAQIVAVQLRNAKQNAMDRRTDVYVMFKSSSMQTYYVYHDSDNDDSYEYIPLETPKSFDSGINFTFNSQGVKEIPNTTSDGHVINNIPLYEKCLVFDRKGFLQVSPVNIVLSNSRMPRQSVSVGQTSDNLAVNITWY